MRVYYIGPTYVKNQKVAIFDPTRWDPAKAPLLYQPVCLNNAATCSGSCYQQSAHPRVHYVFLRPIIPCH